MDTPEVRSSSEQPKVRPLPELLFALAGSLDCGKGLATELIALAVGLQVTNRRT